MLNAKGFDLWADGYDKSVGLADEENRYPFAGYKEVLNRIYGIISAKERSAVLDIGFGTGTLTQKLYEQGHTIWGQDFSGKMLETAKAKMPEAHLFQGDFSQGLAEAVLENSYDFIVATYSLHHLTDARKIALIRSLTALLKEGGTILVGDVAFETRADLERCRDEMGDQWDTDEIYFVFDELKEALPELTFQKVSYCAGLLRINAGSRGKCV